MINPKYTLIMAEIGKRISKHRNNKSISVNQLSQDSGLSYDEIKQIEIGKTDLRVNELLSLCNALNIDVKEIIVGM